MNISFNRNTVTLNGVKDFSLAHTFLCGQCFRWNENDDGSFSGVANGRVIKISAVNDNITLYNTNLQEFNEIWSNYFDFSRNYDEIKKELSKDEIMKRATAYGWGIRILQQDLWETLISFIISQSNNIPRIKQIIERLCESYGDRIFMDGKAYYTFPSYERLKGCVAEDLAHLRAGYRAKYIADAVYKVNSGDVDLSLIKTLPLYEAKQSLMNINGIGHKVADCVLLFGAGRFGVFPVDTWIEKAMRGLYPCVCENEKNIRTAGENIFGRYCGLAQQYLFYYARDNKLKF